MSERDDGAGRGPSTPWKVARTVLLVLAAYAVVGALAGVVWEAVWTPPGQVIAEHHVFFDSYASLRRVFTGTGWYVVVGSVASALVSLVVCLLTRHRALLTLALVVVGSAIGAAVMLKIGTSLGPPDPATLAAHTVKRTIVPGELTVDGTSHLGIKSPYLVWPTASLLVLAVVFIILPVPPFPRDRHATSPIGPGYGGMPPTYGDPRAPAGMSTDVGRHQATPPSDGRARLVDEIRSVRFTPVRIRRGYDMGSVDRLLDDAAQALGRGEPLAPMLEAPQLATVSWREAYDTSEVDTFLETLRNSANRTDTHR